MKTKIKTSSKPQVQSILNNNNFLNSQNYTISSWQLVKITKIVNTNISIEKLKSKYFIIDYNKKNWEYKSWLSTFSFLLIFFFLIPLLIIYIFQKIDEIKIIIYILSFVALIPIIIPYVTTKQYNVYFNNKYLIIENLRYLKYKNVK